MPAPELEWKVYEVTEGVVGERDAIAPAEAPVDVWIPDLSEYPEALDKAKILLETAAEVEHALLVQYLYAAFSLKGSAEVADDSDERADVQCDPEQHQHTPMTCSAVRCDALRD